MIARVDKAYKWLYNILSMSNNTELLSPDEVAHGLAELSHRLHPNETSSLRLRLERAGMRAGAVFSAALAMYHAAMSGVIGVSPLVHAPELFAQDRVPIVAFALTALASVAAMRGARRLNREIAGTELSLGSAVNWPADAEDFEQGSAALRPVQGYVLEGGVEQYAA
jgi:hypothetical protein